MQTQALLGGTEVPSRLARACEGEPSARVFAGPIFAPPPAAPDFSPSRTRLDRNGRLCWPWERSPQFSSNRVYLSAGVAFLSSSPRTRSSRTRCRSRWSAASRSSLPLRIALTPIMKTTRHTCSFIEDRTGSSSVIGPRTRSRRRDRGSCRAAAQSSPRSRVPAIVHERARLSGG
jgi:hypothetical protein